MGEVWLASFSFRWLSIFSMISGSSMQATILTGPLHFSHALMSMPNTRLSLRAQVMAICLSTGERSSGSVAFLKTLTDPGLTTEEKWSNPFRTLQ